MLSLFTKIPVKETTEIVIKTHTSLYWQIFYLLHSTTQLPFCDQYGNIYTQSDSVAMGLCLGFTIFNFCINILKNKVFNNFINPSVCDRYIDDNFILTKNKDKLKTLKEILENN